MLGVRVLGPLEAEVDGRAVDLGGPRQRAVLALLLTAHGDVVSVDRMIDDLWRGEPPPRAIASLQAYVSNLRRLLEPGRSPRAPARVLVSAPPGYAVRLDDDAVDAWRFEHLLRQARAAAAASPGVARATLNEALALWRGPAFAEVADEPWAAAESARLEELGRSGRELLVEVTLRSGAAAEAVPSAQLLTRAQPLREEGWRLLALALWGSGRQADALDALRRARGTLVEQLGLDPGPALVELEQAILTQRVDVLHSSVSPPTAPSGVPVGVSSAETLPAGEVFVGRTRELDTLTATAGEARRTGPRVVLVAGEPGVGKSSLLAHFQGELETLGWNVVVGRCPDTDGAPPAWAWIEALRALAGRLPPAEELAGPLAPLLHTEAAGMPPDLSSPDVPTGRFRLHRAVCAWLAAAAALRPLAVVLDDVHDADSETLALLAELAEELRRPPVLLVAAYRPSDVRKRLADTLAQLARHSPVRLALGGLAAPDVARLVEVTCGAPVDAGTLDALAERTGGNPFYVRESARLLASEGALVATSEVPEGVRDVLRRRLARLPQAAVAVLRLAAVIGIEADVEVLVQAADADETTVLDALEAGLIAGLLTEPAPGRVRFVHALVRDTMYTDLSRLRRARMHTRVGAALTRLRPDDLPGLAHHYAQAASSETAALAVDYAVRAAELAERRYAHDAAAELLTRALECVDRLPAGPEPADRDAQRVELLGRLLRAQVRAGAVTAARTTREQAIEVAERTGRDDLLVAAFTAWTEPTPWVNHPYAIVDERIVGLLLRLLERDPERNHERNHERNPAYDPAYDATDPATRCWLLDALGTELAGEADPRAARAAQEAVELGRRLGNPAILALALTAEARETDFEQEADRRSRLATELASLADAHGLLAYRWMAEHILATAAAARGDVTATHRHVEWCLSTARAYRMAEPEAVGACAQAMLDHIGGRFDDAERRYVETTEAMLRHGSLHALAFRHLALVTLRVSQGRMGAYEPQVRALYEQYGPIAADALALALVAIGRHDEARVLRRELPPLRRDYFFSVFATLRAMAVVALDERDRAGELYAALLPVRDVVAGAASISLAMRPVAHSLGELALLLGRPAEAREHLAHAVEVARRWGSAHWEAEARAALATLRPVTVD